MSSGYIFTTEDGRKWLFKSECDFYSEPLDAKDVVEFVTLSSAELKTIVGEITSAKVEIQRMIDTGEWYAPDTRVEGLDKALSLLGRVE